jgi:[glutamine synthetase] adenylyltransferase / [glutamine synthetase]-adenylyl-L-tyrosine phosphorylase
LHERDERIERLARELPDPEGALRFWERLAGEYPRAARKLLADAALLSDALAVAAWSPLLAATLAQQPDYLTWLARERADAHVRAVEELHESLARFALTHTREEPPVVLARFRRRELLRIYLRDIRRTATVVETTEELSNLADAVLTYALDLARQQLDNRYGQPLRADERGRKTTADFTVVALGKLGSRELNYASDIDLLFLYSDDGETSGAGERGQTTNREYFTRLAERVARLVGGQAAGEGAAYRVDLRLRPHGRTGALAVSLKEALRYYNSEAQAWELQTLIRARAAAGSTELFARFHEGVRERVYTHAGTVAQALSNVRLAKQKIDREHGEGARGYNLKLGRGGIREIEFVAQALQLAHGGRDRWLRHAPHTLVSLGRLADRGYITARERAELSAAYNFLRAAEHRLQMEHGLQTHTVPDDTEKRALLARRMSFTGEGALAEFERELAAHTANVCAAFERVFGAAATGRTHERADGASCAEDAQGGAPPRAGAVEAAHRGGAGESRGETVGPPGGEAAESARARAADASPDSGGGPRALAETRGESRRAVAAAIYEADAALSRSLRAAAEVFAAKLRAADAPAGGVARLLEESVGEARDPRRAAAVIARVAASLDKSDEPAELSAAALRALARLCGASEFFGEMIAGAPALASALEGEGPAAARAGERDFRALLRAAVDRERTFRAELAALRRAWSRLLVETAALDLAGGLDLAASNRAQTELAVASVNVALLVARRELARRYGRLSAGPRLAVLALGRLASGGMDYGSDLDIVLVFDDRTASPVRGLAREEAYARLAELMTAALSSVTREGHLYRVDLRLRPDGKSGPVARGAESFVSYVARQANVWEWLAYVKLRAAGGDLEFGRAVERRARRAVHDAALKCDREKLRLETRRVRERLLRERARGGAAALDIKFGAGGMLDVYFAARYLQLRDRLPDEGEDRSTAATLARLRDAGSLGAGEHDALSKGYALLRRIDHRLRLTTGRSTRLPAAADHPTLRDLAAALDFASPADLLETLRAHAAATSAAYERITSE